MLLTASAIYSPHGWLRDHVLDLDAKGRIEALRPRHAHDQPQVYPDYLIPGWVNAHCHLELSALAQDIPEGTGMTGFIGRLFRARAGYSAEELAGAALTALRKLAEQGTMAVGDISNLPASIAAKAQVKEVWTHTFVEVLGLAEEQAQPRLQAAQQLARSFAEAGLSHSLTPHAPYSVARGLFRSLYQQAQGPLSLHLLESVEEVELFATGQGPFERFYAELGLPYRPFAATDAIAHATEALPAEAQMLFVHNVELSGPALRALHQRFPRARFVLCPRANWYIHRRLPPVPAFASLTDRLCLGTDSLASNHSLDLGEEVAFLLKAFPQLSLHQVISWGTTHGAQALGLSDRLGSFQVGTQPGVLHWDAVACQAQRVA